MDLHNQARQFDLGLEKKWVTHNGYFRLYTTLLGMTVTDTWKQLKKKQEGYNSITNFSDILAKEMLEYAKSFEDHEEHTVDTVSETRTCDDISSLSQDKVIGTHTKIFLDTKHQLRCIWCSRVNLLQWKTTLKCKECGKGFCRDSSGSNCWSNHVCFGGVPACPKRGTHKRLVRDIDDEENCTR